MLKNLLGTYLGHNFVAIAVAVLALLDIRHCSKLQSCAISKKTNKSYLRKCPKKTNFDPDLGPCGPNLCSQTFFVNFTSTGC